MPKLDIGIHKVIMREMCACVQGGHKMVQSCKLNYIFFGTQNQSLIFPARTMEKNNHASQGGVNYYHSLSHYDGSPLSQKNLHRSPVFVSLRYFFHPDIVGSKEEKSRRRKHEKKEIKRERLCIFLYIKSVISDIATKGQGLEFHSLSCPTDAVTVTLCLFVVSAAAESTL